MTGCYFLQSGGARHERVACADVASGLVHSSARGVPDLAGAWGGGHSVVARVVFWLFISVRQDRGCDMEGGWKLSMGPWIAYQHHSLRADRRMASEAPEAASYSVRWAGNTRPRVVVVGFRYTHALRREFGSMACLRGVG